MLKQASFSGDFFAFEIGFDWVCFGGVCKAVSLS
jgi:hypothetical protein